MYRPMLPFSIFLNAIANLVAIGLIGLNYYLIDRWCQTDCTIGSLSSNVTAISIFSILLTLLNFTGWIFAPFILSKVTGKNITKERLRRESDQVELFVEKYPATGCDTTLIFTHGWSTTAQIWYYFRKALGGKYNLIFWDEPGLGKSKQPTNDDYSLTKYATDLKNIVATVPANQKIILVGHSIGGMIIQQLFKDYPGFAKDKIKGIALFNTTYINPIKTALFGDFFIKLQNILIKPALYIQAYTWPIWQLNNLFSFLNGSLHIAGYVSGFRGNQTRNELNFTTQLMLTSRVDTVAKGTLGMLRLDTISILPSISVPALVIGGQNDIMTKAFASEVIAKNIPNSTLHIIKNNGHMGPLENAKVYINYLQEFITLNFDQ
jgi:pimeloyl-ACP methyl ester carboxylesterase